MITKSISPTILTKSVISRNWIFGFLAAMTALVFGFVLYQSGRHLKARYDRMKQLVRKKEKEIELLTDLWKINGSEIEWLEPISRGILECDFIRDF